MKNNLKKIVLLLPVLPMLMANAPAPTAHPKKYEDFAVSIVDEKYVSGSDAHYEYTYHIKNNGVGYISYVSVSSTERDEEGYYDYYGYFSDGDFDAVFTDAVIAPNQEINVTASIDDKIADFSAIKYKGNAYFDFADDVEVSGSLAISKSENWSGYSIDMTLSGGDSDKYNYGAIIKFTYDGSEHYIHTDEFRSFSFTTQEGFELSKVTKVEVINVTRSVSYGYGCNNVYKVINTFLIFFAICVLFLICCGIFAAIFFPIMRRRRRARREKKNEQL